MKVKALRELSAEELAKKAEELKQERYALRFQHHTGQLENPMRIRQTRRALARVKTLLAEGAARPQNQTSAEGTKRDHKKS